MYHTFCYFFSFQQSHRIENEVEAKDNGKEMESLQEYSIKCSCDYAGVCGCPTKSVGVNCLIGASFFVVIEAQTSNTFHVPVVCLSRVLDAFCI